MRLRRMLVPLLVSVGLVGVLFVFVFPSQTFLAQRTSIARAEDQLRVLGKQNDVLTRRAAELQRDAEVERLAREQYNLVKPGEEAYAVLPPPVTATVPEPAPDAPVPDKDEGNILQRAWRGITGLF